MSRSCACISQSLDTTRQLLEHMWSGRQPSGLASLRLFVAAICAETSPKTSLDIVSPVVGSPTQPLTAQIAPSHPRNHPSEEVLPMADRIHKTTNPLVWVQATKRTLQSLRGTPRPLNKHWGRSLTRHLSIQAGNWNARRTCD
jgi:hypothetical protein